MRIDFDKESDAIYFRLNDSEIVESEEIAPGIVYDFDENDTVVGIEVLNLKHKKTEHVKQIGFPFTQEEKERLKEVFSLFACA